MLKGSEVKLFSFTSPLIPWAPTITPTRTMSRGVPIIQLSLWGLGGGCFGSSCGSGGNLCSGVACQLLTLQTLLAGKGLLRIVAGCRAS